MLSQEKKQKIIDKYSQGKQDTGSPEVQAAVFTEEVNELRDHLKDHPKDNSARRGLLKMVSKRKRLLDYLKKKDEDRYDKLAKDLKLKKQK